jgi:adenosylmethionine-8-amino-7-oxononanoate aminotransferase
VAGGAGGGDGVSHDDWVERDSAHLWHGFTQMATYAGNAPLIIEAAEGREVIDVDGRRYLDAISSLWVTTLGHRVPELDEALSAQLDKVAHTTLLGNGNVAAIELAEALAPRLPVDDAHLLFASDGAAAAEQALRIAFQWWTNAGVDDRTTYLALGDAYHGDTIGSLSVGAGGFGTDVYDPLRFPVVRTPGYVDPRWADRAVEAVDAHHERLAALVIEPLVQGAAGIQVAEPADVQRVVEHAQARDVLVIADEVATGFGRTGELFASDRCGIRPDLAVVGKGITGGYLPLSATAASRDVYDGFLGEDLGERTLYHGHSYSGNALACAVARRHLELVDEWEVLASVRSAADRLAGLLEDRIAPTPAVGAIRQCGLMVGVELAPPAPGLRWGRRACAGTVDRGVLLRPLGDVVVLMPPLTTTHDELERIIAALEASLQDLVD